MPGPPLGPSCVMTTTSPLTTLQRSLEGIEGLRGYGNVGRQGRSKRIVITNHNRDIIILYERNDIRSVHKSVAYAGYYIGGGGAGSYYHHSRAAGDARVSLCSMCGSLFVTYQHVFQAVLIVVQLVVYRYYGSSRITEYEHAP